MKMFFTLEYYECVGGRAKINFWFIAAEDDPITILKMDRYFDEVYDDPLEYLQSYSDTDELKEFWAQFSKEELYELLVTEGISEYFEFHGYTPGTTSPKNSPLEIGSLENTNPNPLITFNLNSLV